MNSEERHRNRYKRRLSKRINNKKKLLLKLDNIENVANLNNLKEAMLGCCSGVMFKVSVQKYRFNYLKNITELRKDILEGNDVRKGFINFDLVERGKKRHISSIHIQERPVQKSLCQNVLMPYYKKELIYDNGACIKNKGVSFALKRTVKHLTKYYKRYGNEGYVLQFDFKSYFDTISHSIIKDKFHKDFHDEKLVKLFDDFLDAFTGNKGLGLGSEICQILAVSFPNKLDHFIKDLEHNKYYERYMDDGFIIHKDKQYLINLLKQLNEILKELGLKFHDYKTQIRKISKGFTFLKTHFVLLDNGRVLRLPGRRTITTERRKVKKLYDKVDITQQFSSWLGYISWKDSFKTVNSMLKLIYNLCGGKEQWKKLKQTKNCAKTITQIA